MKTTNRGIFLVDQQENDAFRVLKQTQKGGAPIRLHSIRDISLNELQNAKNQTMEDFFLFITNLISIQLDDRPGKQQESVSISISHYPIPILQFVYVSYTARE